MPTRDIYLKIEAIPDYSPVEPDDHVTPPIQYGRDCMRNDGHEDGTIPPDEIAARRLTALVYREYLDSHLTRGGPHAFAPKGYYMLFILDSERVASAAKWDPLAIGIETTVSLPFPKK